MTAQGKAVVLASGGVDSSTTLAIAKKEGFQVYALTIDYGQRHHLELEAARRVVKHLRAVRHAIIKVDLRTFGGSALTTEMEVPKNRAADQMAVEIPITYVPARNTVFLSLALGWCEVLEAEHLFIGVNAVDYSGYPDCRPQFLEAFERLANVATKAGVEGRARYRIRAPLLHMTKAEIIRAGLEAGVDFSLTHSCYDPAPAGLACGACDSCQLRLQGFREAGIPDPVRYAEK